MRALRLMSAKKNSLKWRWQINMKVFSICLIFILLLLAPPFISSAHCTDINRGYKAVVSQHEAAFTFPINPQKQYEWCPGGLQYAWNIKARNGKDGFEFGFSLFTPMGASPCGKGNFTALLNEGQFDIWKVKKGGSSVVPGFKIDHAVSGDGRLLTIRLKDKKVIDLIFSKKPKHVIFQSQVLERKSSKKVPVVYGEQ